MKKCLLWALFILTIPSLGALEVYDFYGRVVDLLSPRNTATTSFPTLLIPMGGQGEALANAYTAVAGDAGYFDANPAASAVLDTTELAVYHNNFIATATMDSAVYTIRWNDLGFGAAAKVLHDSFTEYGPRSNQESSGTYAEAVAGLNIAYNLFSGYYFQGLAVGANVKLAYRNVPNRIAPGQNAGTVLGDLGMLTRFNFLKFYASRDRNVAVGASARNFGLPALGEPTPSAFTAGLSYRPLRPLLFAFDFSLPVTLVAEVPPPPPGFAFGSAVTVTEFFEARTGFALERGSPRITLGGDVDLADVSFAVNYTLDLTTQFGTLDRFSVQARFNFGDRGRAERRARVEELYLQSLDAFAAGNLEEAERLAARAVEIDSSFDPAEETLETVRRAIRLQREMEELGDIRTEEDRLRGNESGP
jgi:hypothetical protein